MCRSRVCWSKEWRSLPTEFSAVFAKPILRVGGTLLAIGLRIKEQVAINSGDLKWRGNGAEKGQKQREHLRDDAQSLGPQAGMQLHVDVGVEDHPAQLSPHKIHVGHP